MLTPELAEKILSLRVDPEVTARILELGEKAGTETLTEAEHDEYKYLVDAGDFISLLKAKARRFLAAQSR